MPTILEVLNKTKDFLESKGIDRARLNAELLLAKGLDCKRLDLYLRHEEFLDEKTLEKLRTLVQRRGKREPLQHIIGNVEFYGLTLTCDSRALIPRPETEYFVELLLERYATKKTPNSILELGTGSGAIVLTLASELKNARFVACDISSEALELAKANAESLELSNRIEFIQSDWFNSLPKEQFDWIISNPPYLTQEEYKEAEPEVRDHDPIQALVGGNEDGLAAIEKILKGALAYLKPGGMIALETGIAQHKQLEKLCQTLGYKETSSSRDLNKLDRFFIADKSA